MTFEEMKIAAKQAKSAAELLAIAEENGIELTEEQAAAYFEQPSKSGEISDDELDNVSGGGCGSSSGSDLRQEGYQCPKCGSSEVALCGIPGKIPMFSCNVCGYVDCASKFIKVK